MQPHTRKVLLIGWDAADWKIATPLMDQGLMPCLNDFVNCGVMGNLATLQPVLSPMLWNSIATGKHADKHGIHGFIEPDPNSGGVRPVTSTSRRVKAIWNILTQKGFKTHVLGWFAGHPAEPINGVCVSDLYPIATAPPDQPWPLPDGAVHPESLRDPLSELRMHPAEVDASMVFPFIPKLQKVDQKKDHNLSAFVKTLSENVSIHNAATWILETQPWDFMAVYYNGIDHFCHAFMHFHPPRLQCIPEDLFELYKDVVTGAYRFHDMLLARLLYLAGRDTTVILCSDHGFHSDHLRPLGIPNEPAGPAVQHRRFGVIAMAGNHIKKDERIYGATLLDVTPTILTLFGLPIGEDMDGRVLVEAFDEAPQIERIPSWEQEPGECGMHPADLRMDPDSANAVLQQFAALGYIGPTDDQKKSVEIALREAKYNLARVYMDKRRPLQALPMFEDLYKQQPEQARFAQHLAQCYLALRRIEDAKRVLTELVNRPPAPKKRKQETEAAGAAPGSQELSPAGSGPSVSGAETAAGTNRPWADWLMGVIKFEEGDMEGALELLLRAEHAQRRMPDLHLRIGQAYLRLRRLEDAERAFHEALEIDADSAEGHLGLACVMLRKRQDDRAVEEALAAVSLQHFLPMGHFYLGVALARLAHFRRATLAFETAIAMAPGFLVAHRFLVAVNRRPGGDLAKAIQHKKWIGDFIRRRREALNK